MARLLIGCLACILGWRRHCHDLAIFASLVLVHNLRRFFDELCIAPIERVRVVVGDPIR